MLDVAILLSFVVFMVGIVSIVVGLFRVCTAPENLDKDESKKLRRDFIKLLVGGTTISLLGFVILQYLCPLLRG